jgi:chromosomal replication initiation ATPase DnaA
MTRQLGLDLPSVPALGRADFLVAPSNAVALAMIEDWPNWRAGKLLLCGPEGAGKTHLAHVWASETGARILPARALASIHVPEAAAGALVVEDIHGVAGVADAEEALFHLHNLMAAEGHPLLLTLEGAPKAHRFVLPDLASRIGGTPAAYLDPPDDVLLAALLAKLFADRQLTPGPEVIQYLVRRMDRSFAAARDIVARLDAASLAEKRPVTRGLAAKLLDNNLF